MIVEPIAAGAFHFISCVFPVPLSLFCHSFVCFASRRSRPLLRHSGVQWRCVVVCDAFCVRTLNKLIGSTRVYAAERFRCRGMIQFYGVHLFTVIVSCSAHFTAPFGRCAAIHSAIICRRHRIASHRMSNSFRFGCACFFLPHFGVIDIMLELLDPRVHSQAIMIAFYRRNVEY